MDFVKMKTRMIEIFEKYKYVWIVLLAGMILMMLGFILMLLDLPVIPF